MVYGSGRRWRRGRLGWLGVDAYTYFNVSLLSSLLHPTSIQALYWSRNSFYKNKHKNETYSTKSFPVVAALGFSGGLESPSLVSVIAAVLEVLSFLASAWSPCNRITSMSSSRFMSNRRLTRSFSLFSDAGLSGVGVLLLGPVAAAEFGGKFGVWGVFWPCGCCVCAGLLLWVWRGV